MIKSHWKILFEVQLLHEYYLSENLDDDFFALPDAGRLKRVRDNLENGTYDIWNDLEILPTEGTAKLLRKYELRFIKTKLGFFVGVKLRSGGAVGGELFPSRKFSKPLELNFRICPINRSFSAITNLKQQKLIPAVYYFNNFSDIENRSLPVLSLSVPEFIEGILYEMGELARFSNNLKQAIVSTANGDSEDWKSLASDGLVSEADRSLLPPVFSCSIPMSLGITNLEFILKKQTGEILKSFVFSETEPITTVDLDFTTPASNSGVKIDEGFYQMEIVFNETIRQTKRVFMSTKLYNKYCLGILAVNTGIASSPFRIFKNNGALDHSRNNYDTTKHPLFEIRFNSRLSYWCYYSKARKELSTTDQTDKFLVQVGDHLQTREARPLKAVATEFSAYNETLGQDEHLFLPNPCPAAMRIEHDGNIYTPIYTSRIDGLIEEN